MADVGFSGAPLAKKLGIKAPLTMLLINPPEEYLMWIGGVPDGVKLVVKAKKPLDAVHLFAVERKFLDAVVSRLRTELREAGFIWVSWPKKSSRIATDITEDAIREIALPLGFVDIKVCAVSEVWSGLKLVIRKSYRK
jgi:hypothetical protein